MNKRIAALWEAEENCKNVGEPEIPGKESDLDVPSECSDHETDTEQPGTEENIEDGPTRNNICSCRHILPVYLDQDNVTSWYVHKPNELHTRIRIQNIVTQLPGVKTLQNIQKIISIIGNYFSLKKLTHILFYVLIKKSDEMRKL